MNNEPTGADKLREAWIGFWKRERRRARQWVRFEMCGPHYPRPLPECLRGLQCGAKLRDGTRCTSTDISTANGRCHSHGGASSGPKTLDGKRRAAANGRLGEIWARMRAELEGVSDGRR